MARILVVGDSVIEKLQLNHRVTMLCCPGAGVKTLAFHMQHFHGTFDMVVLHVGTNDIGMLPPEEFHAAYKMLVDHIKSKFGSPKVLASSVLPRPRDHKDNCGQVVAFNQEILRLVASHDVLSLCKGYRKFMRCGQVLSDLFSDGLHLTPKGYTLLAMSLDGRISNFMKLL